MSPALAGGFLTTAPPGKSQKYCFLSVLHVGLPCKIYWREGSIPQINFEIIIRRLERYGQHGQRGEVGSLDSGFGSLAGRKGHVNGSGRSCVCRSCADVSVCSSLHVPPADPMCLSLLACPPSS